MNYTLLTITLILFIYFVYIKSDDSVYALSDLDNNMYLIRRGKGKSEAYLKESANTLAKIHVRIIKLIEHLKTNFKTHPVLDILQARYNHNVLSEAAIDDRYTSFTINKKDMHICLRTRDQSEIIYNINILMYVVLHELAHIANFDKNGNPIEGHGEEFVNIFRFLVNEAVLIGVYNYTDYEKQPTEYCGMMITTQIA